MTPDAVLIFLMPPSKQELVNRLKQRHGQLDNELYSRLETAQEELECLPLFDYVVITQKDKLDVTVSEINAIVTAEKCRVQPRIIRL
jgi:guanylate kinase